jgi:hypothetical protein
VALSRPVSYRDVVAGAIVALVASDELRRELATAE